MALTIKARLFVSYYLGKAEGNATRAALLAGYRQPQMAGPRMMKKDAIRDAIEGRMNEVAMEAAEVLLRLSTLASTDADDFLHFDADADPKDPPRLDLRKAKRRRKLGCIKKLKHTDVTFMGKTTATIEVELHDAHRALVTLAKFHGLLEPKAEAAPDDDYEVDLSADRHPPPEADGPPA